MKPHLIYQHLGPTKIDEYFDQLSGKEIRSILKAGKASASVSSTTFTQAARRKTWRKRLDSAVDNQDDRLAMAFLLEWLLGHHRSMLSDYLDALGVTHTNGETDDDFCDTKQPEELASAAETLFAKYPAHQVATYLLLVGHMHETRVYDQMAKIVAALGIDPDKAQAYAEEQQELPRKITTKKLATA